MQRAAQVTFALWIAIAAVAARAANPAVTALDAASADAQVVVVIPQLGDASRKLAGWFNAAGLAADAQMQDLLGNTKREMGVAGGFNDNGPLVLVLKNLAAAEQEGGAPDVVMLVPVSDYAAFITGFGGNADGVSELKLKDGSTGFAKSSGGFAVLGRDRAVVEAYQPAGDGGAMAAKLGPAGADALDRADAAIYIDIKSIGPRFASLMQAGLGRAREQGAAMGAPSLPGASMLSGAGGAGLPGAAAFTGLFSGAADLIAQGADAMVIGFDISDAGLGVTKAVRTHKSGELAAYFPGGKADAAAQLARLPNQPYVAALAVDGAAIDLAKVAQAYKGASDPAAAEMVALGREARSLAFVMYAPDQNAMMAGSLTDMTWLITADDGEAYLKLVQGYVNALNGRKKPINPDAPDGPAVNYTASYTAGALNLQGVSVDQFLIQQQMPPEMYAQMGQLAGFANLMGSFRGYAAAKGTHVVITTSADPQAITRALATVEAGDGLGGDAAIADLRKSNLPAGSAMEAYLDLGGVNAMVGPLLMLIGAPPLEIPPALPPIAVAIRVDGDTLIGRGYLPTADVKLIVDAMNSVQSMAPSFGPGNTGGQRGGPAPY